MWRRQACNYLRLQATKRLAAFHDLDVVAVAAVEKDEARAAAYVHGSVYRPRGHRATPYLLCCRGATPRRFGGPGGSLAPEKTSPPG